MRVNDLVIITKLVSEVAEKEFKPDLADSEFRIFRETLLCIYWYVSGMIVNRFLKHTSGIQLEVRNSP